MKRPPAVPYQVRIELPAQTIEVYARDADAAVFQAWNMIGLAGVKHYGTVAVVVQGEQAA